MSNQNKTKHTPGPWTIEGLIESNGVGAYRIVEPNNTYAVADVYEIEGRIENAHLIAAAPEMLEALERCLIQLMIIQDPTDECELTMKLVRGAIAKAKGQ